MMIKNRKNKRMKKIIAAAGFVILFFSLLSAGNSVMNINQEWNPSDSTKLAPKPVYSEEARLIVRILDAFHYKPIGLNDSLSSVILDEYIKALDNNKSYFLASDIEGFEKYRFEIDDLTKDGDVKPAYYIYNTFYERFNERMQYVKDSLVSKSFNFDVEESYNSDRSDKEWAQDREQLNEVWRKVVKSQALSLKLSGKTDDELQDILKKRYDRFSRSFSQNNPQDIFELFMNTLTGTYDPHTNYFSPSTSDKFKQSMSLSLEGIGARLQTEYDFTKVVQVLPGGPADKSNGIQQGDRIIGVAQGEDGEMVDVVGWRIDDVVGLIKGPKGTTVKLELLPAETGVDGPSKILSLVRDKIKLEDQRAKKEIIPIEKEGKLYKMGVITIPTFYMDFEAYRNGDPDYTSTTRDVKKLISELQESRVDGVLIDLRNNGGGSLAEAIDLTGLFIDEGPVVQIRNKSNKIEVGTDDDTKFLYSGPLTVLINRFSASASEIFAGAIQDYGRGLIVGEQTFGKGTVQSMVDLAKYLPESDKEEVGQLKLTLQKFYRITGSSTQHQGVSPDVELPSAFSGEQFGESSNPSALPWDRIKATDYTPTTNVNQQLISEIRNEHLKRMKTDPNLISLVDETNELRKNLKDNTISLNYSVRKKEMEKSSTVSKNTSVDIEDTSDDSEKIKDKVLQEGLTILATVIRATV
jgi:carboxyl-terminal processing protease